MDQTCPRCQATVPEGSVFCPMCGMPLRADAAITTRQDEPADGKEIVPLPDVDSPQARRRRRRRHRKPWYRRLRVLVPLAIVALLLLTLGAGAWYIKTRFDTLNELSTPPPEISGARLGGDEELVIDTGPAQDAVREAEARREAARRNPPPTADLTATGTVAAEDGESERADGGDGAAPVAGASGDGDGQVAEAPVIEINAEGTPVLVNAPVGTPALASVPEPVEPDSYAFLMMGVDARPGEAIDVGVRPDSLFLVYLDGGDGSCRVLSIPRDTRAYLPGYGYSKINHALAVGGVPYERLVVEDLTGIEIAHYGLIDFAGVETLVDSIGGVTVTNDYAFTAGGFDFPEGRLELDGERALVYSRYRGGPDGDFGRQERQQAVVRGILTQGADLDVVREIPRLLNAVDDHVRTDLGPDQMVDIAQDFRATCNGGTLETSRVEGDVAWAYDELMAMELSFVLVDPAEVDRKVAWLLTGDENAAIERPTPIPATPVGTPAATPAASPGSTPVSRRAAVSGGA